MSLYSITERRVPELIPVVGSQPAGVVSHKPGGRLPLLSTRPAITPATHKDRNILIILTCRRTGVIGLQYNVDTTYTQAIVEPCSSW